MTSKEYLAAYTARMAELKDRLQKAVDGLSDEHFNQKQSNGWWSIGQIIDHLNIATAPYLSAMTETVKAASKQGGTDEVKHTWFANMLIGAMDKPSTPAPKSMLPHPGPLDKSVLEAWLKQTEDLLALAKNASEVNLTEAKIRNPFVKLMKMNLADMFEVIVAHTERHVKQIEGLVAGFA